MKMKLTVFALSVASIFAQPPGPTMKAIVARQWGGPEALTLEDVAIPTPKKNEMLIKVFASGVNSFDGTLLTGKYNPRRFSTISRTKPSKSFQVRCQISYVFDLLVGDPGHRVQVHVPLKFRIPKV